MQCSSSARCFSRLLLHFDVVVVRKMLQFVKFHFLLKSCLNISIAYVFLLKLVGILIFFILIFLLFESLCHFSVLFTSFFIILLCYSPNIFPIFINNYCSPLSCLDAFCCNEFEISPVLSECV